jgi:hypothetical protein
LIYNVAKEVAIIANRIFDYFPFFSPNKKAIVPAINPANKRAHSVETK